MLNAIMAAKDAKDAEEQAKVGRKVSFVDGTVTVPGLARVRDRRARRDRRAAVGATWRAAAHEAQARFWSHGPKTTARGASASMQIVHRMRSSSASFSRLTLTSAILRRPARAGGWKGAVPRRRPRARALAALARLRAGLRVDHGDGREALELAREALDLACEAVALLLDVDEARLDLGRRVGVGLAARVASSSSPVGPSSRRRVEGAPAALERRREWAGLARYVHGSQRRCDLGAQ